MARAKNEFTNVTSLRAEALGDPGARTFRILVDNGVGGGSAIIWLEKEQLSQLALVMQQLLATLPREPQAGATQPPDRETPAPGHVDFKVSKIALGYERGSGLFIIDADDDDDENEDPATIRVWANGEQVKKFSEESLRVCAAGRPLCPLCSRPLDASGHQCPRVNGHVKATDL